MTKKNIELAIYISAILLAVGVFLPLTKLPIYGSVTYNKIASFESYLVILFAIVGPVLLLMGKVRELKFASIGIWVTLFFPTIKGLFKSDSGGFFSRVGDKASSVMQEFAGDLFLNIFEFSWGGFIFILALLVYTASTILRSLK